jgi:hypothetical protein
VGPGGGDAGDVGVEEQGRAAGLSKQVEVLTGHGHGTFGGALSLGSTLIGRH